MVFFDVESLAFRMGLLRSIVFFIRCFIDAKNLCGLLLGFQTLYDRPAS